MTEVPTDSLEAAAGFDEPDADTRRLTYTIAGVQKGGTSTLHALLQQHPQVARTRRKELHFFDSEKPDWSKPNYKRLHAKVEFTDGCIGGDATPRYVYLPAAMSRVAAYNPAIRIVLSFRDPIERAFSHWSMLQDRKGRKPAFAASIRGPGVRSWPRPDTPTERPSRAYVTRGYYGAQLAYVLTLFPRDQVLALDYAVVFADLPAALNEITDFLGIDSYDGYATDTHLRAQPPALSGPAVTAADIEHLASLYADDLAQFAGLSGIDVSQWSTARVLAGGLSPAELAAKLSAKAGLGV